MNKNVVYTCIIGKYDTLKEIQYKTPGFDHICFTDQNFKSDSWEIRPIPDEIKNLSEVRQNRYLKINAHKIFPEYDFSIYIDGSMTITKDLNKLKNNIMSEENKCMYLLPHTNRNCIYAEFLQCTKIEKENINTLYAQMSFYVAEHFPFNYGLTHNCILFRYHNNEKCIEIMDKVWEMIETYSHRDQLSMMYAIWKTNNRQYISIINTELIMPYISYSTGWFHDLYCERALKNEVNKAKYLISTYLSKDFESKKYELICKYVLKS